jgi:hypothetical protein
LSSEELAWKTLMKSEALKEPVKLAGIGAGGAG